MKPDSTWFKGSGRAEFPLAPGAVLAAVIAKDRSLSRARVLSLTEWQELLREPGALERSLGQCGLPSAQWESFRLVGEKAGIAALSESLRATTLPIGKHVPVSTGATIHFLPKEGRIRVAAESLLSGEVEPRRRRVLVVDDSETIQKLLRHIFSSDPDLECVGVVGRPSLAEEAIERLNPDVLTLDIHMPEMSGVELLKKILAKRRIPVVMISALSKDDGTMVLEALEAGAVDYIQKPQLGEVTALAPVICEKVKSASLARVRASSKKNLVRLTTGIMDQGMLIAIGSSTGGTEALRDVLTLLPADIPPILIVQHIPPVFSKAFADRMARLCPFGVKEAEDNDPIRPGQVLIAPGGKQMKLRETRAGLSVLVDNSAPVNRHRPSVDVLFESIAELGIKRVVGAILTGMGTDGARGLLRLKQAGARTLAQDESTSVVYGMPREAARIGAAEEVVPLGEIAGCLARLCQR